MAILTADRADECSQDIYVNPPAPSLEWREQVLPENLAPEDVLPWLWLDLALRQLRAWRRNGTRQYLERADQLLPLILEARHLWPAAWCAIPDCHIFEKETKI